MKRITAIALFAIAGFVGAGEARAQDQAVQSDIPFKFSVGDKAFPAGTYSVSKEGANIIAIRNRNHAVVALALTMPSPRETKHGAKMVFDQYGDRYFLHEVLSSSNSMNLQIPASKWEKKAQREEAMLHASSQVFIAAR